MSQDDYEVYDVLDSVGDLPHPDSAQANAPGTTVEIPVRDVIRLLDWIRDDPAMDTARDGHPVINSMGSVADDVAEVFEDQ